MGSATTRRRRARRCRTLRTVFGNYDVVGLIMNFVAHSTAEDVLAARVGLRATRNGVLAALIATGGGNSARLCITEAMAIYDRLTSIDLALDAMVIGTTLDCFGLNAKMKAYIGTYCMSIQTIDHFDREGHRKLSIWWPHTSSVLVCRDVRLNGRARRFHGTYTYCNRDDVLSLRLVDSCVYDRGTATLRFALV